MLHNEEKSVMNGDIEASYFLYQHYSHSFSVLRMCIALCTPGFAPGSIYTADNLVSPLVEPTSKPWLDLTYGEPGLGRFTLANLGRTRVSLCSVNWLKYI